MDNDLVGSLQRDIVDLAGHLRRERLFVTSEQHTLLELNEKVATISSRLAQLAWVTSQQRDNLNRLVVARPDCTPAICCQRANSLEATLFVDAFKVMGFQDVLAYGEFLQTLRRSPELLASCLVAGDRLLPDMMHGIVHSLANGLYGSCLLLEDKALVLRLLQYLTQMQLVPSDNPRRLLRQKSCAFARLYSEFHEGLFSAKLFLTASLHRPIMQLLVEHEMFFDIDPDKATVRFPPEERLKKFGPEGGPQYAARLQQYRAWTNSCLAAVTNRFVSALRDNLHFFPPGVSWLVRQIAGVLTKAGNIPAKEVNAICTDLVFTYFICPAMVNPEPYGITDAPISYVARFNLIQVAKIVQVLAMIQYEGVDSKVADLFDLFEKDCVSSLLDAILAEDSDVLEEAVLVADNCKLQGLCRSAGLFTEGELHNLVVFLQTVAAEVKPADAEPSELKKQLTLLLSQLPLEGHAVNGHGSLGMKSGSVQLSSPPGTPHRTGLLGKVGKSRGTRSSASPVRAAEGSEETVNPPDEADDVLVIPFSPNSSESMGLLTEQKVLSLEGHNVTGDLTLSASLLDDSGVPTERGESIEKRTRFSLSHDDGSIGNASDNLEAVSEAASNHSVASSMELENEDQNDNLSDMVSANVSGRGTPNISGRDTPSSQITEGEEGPMRGTAGDQRQSLDFPQSSANKQSRSDIEDKFGKFEIKKLLEGDETVSMVSDTWSTDVLASDSETIEQTERVFVRAEVAIQQLTEATQLLDVSETASEAWSTDVLASDSERLTEVDTDDTASVARSDDTASFARSDDTASVARSDDTARSEIDPEGRGEPEGGEDAPPSSAPMFRPIREDPVGRAAMLVPASPTRVETSHPVWNVTGRGGGKAEYRRRTVEYVDNNRREQEARYPDVVDKPHDLKPAVIAASQASINIAQGPNLVVLSTLPVTNQGSPPTSHNTDLGSRGPSLTNHGVERCSGRDSDHKQELPGEDDTVRLSSASLTSSSSSSGSEPRPKTVTPTPELVLNGDVLCCKAPPSTGAIPKSISFDQTAERGDKDLLDDDASRTKRSSFFRNFKLPFKNRRGGNKSLRGGDDLSQRGFEEVEGDRSNPQRRVRRMSEEIRPLLTDPTSEDILAKYRRKPLNPEVAQQPLKPAPPLVQAKCGPEYCFQDAKRKLRMVMSTADLHQGPSETEPIPHGNWPQNDNELVRFLQLQLAEAINLQDRSLIAHLHETLRCIKLFSDKGCRKLLNSIKEDYQKRSPYIAYLIRCRQGLLSTVAHLKRLMERVRCDREVCNCFLVAVCVTLFLEKREQLLLDFQAEFQQLSLADEKTDLLDNFLHSLALDIGRDSTFQAASQAQLEQARTAVERAVMGRVYLQALYPNGDGDVSRDQVLHEHMAKLSAIITPNHKDLAVPKMFHYECPWPSAQAEIGAMAAYKTPRDKLQCVVRCASTIMNLLAMASDRDVPAADDFVPVLVFVLIKANPPSLLSTVEYVNSFYGNRLQGEDQYWWIQFCSAIEFIKTMDYSD